MCEVLKFLAVNAEGKYYNNGLNSSYLQSTILGDKQDIAEKHVEDINWEVNVIIRRFLKFILIWL